MTQYVVGIDLGGSKSALALIAPDNKLVARERLETGRNAQPKEVLDGYEAIIKKFKKRIAEDAFIAAIGLCAPGPLDHEKGVIINPTNLPNFFDTPLQAMLEERFSVPAAIEHDAKAAALGEFHFGAGRDYDNMVYIVVGTGVGAAIMIDGKLYRGEKNFAGEFGHTTLNRYGDECHCGSRGCYETFMSGPWLSKHYERKTQEVIDGSEVAGRAEDGEEAALEVMKAAGEALGIAVATMAMNFDIERFIVGGSVAKAGDVFLEPARKIIPHYSFETVSSKVSLVKSQLAEDAALLGCAHMARQALKEST